MLDDTHQEHVRDARQADSFLYLYNKEGLLSLPEGQAETVRFRECQGYLNRD